MIPKFMYNASCILGDKFVSPIVSGVVATWYGMLTNKLINDTPLYKGGRILASTSVGFIVGSNPRLFVPVAFVTSIHTLYLIMK